MTNTISPNKPLRSATRVQMITLVGVFAAISTILMFIEMPIPFMPPFLKVDLSGVPILIMGFMYGPLPAIYVTIIKDAIHMLSSQTGCVGEFADMIILCSFSVVSSLLYRKNPSRKGVVISVRSRRCNHHRRWIFGKQIYADSILFQSYASGSNHRCLPCSKPNG